MIVAFLLLLIAAGLYSLLSSWSGIAIICYLIVIGIAIFAIMTDERYVKFMHKHIFLHTLLMLFFLLANTMMAMFLAYLFS